MIGQIYYSRDECQGGLDAPAGTVDQPVSTPGMANGRFILYFEATETSRQPIFCTACGEMLDDFCFSTQAKDLDALRAQAFRATSKDATTAACAPCSTSLMTLIPRSRGMPMPPVTPATPSKRFGRRSCHGSPGKGRVRRRVATFDGATTECHPTAAPIGV